MLTTTTFLLLTQAAVILSYRPQKGDVFQWQLSLDSHHPLDTSMHADIWDSDLWEMTTSQISHIHSKGGRVICYFSAGTLDPGRPDAHQLHSGIGNHMKDWPRERWLDIRDHNVRAIMSARLDEAKRKKCDGVEPDNVDGYDPDHHTGFHFGFDDQIDYNKWLASEAHKRGLAIGLKNDVDQIHELYHYFDFAVNEECHEYDECDKYKPFLAANKPVFNIEYVSGHSVSHHDKAKCSNSPSGMQTQFKIEDVTSWTWRCP